MVGRRRFQIPIFLTLILLLVGISARPYQQITGNGDWYFPETGHTVSGEILDYYQHTEDYILKFGYPISEVEDHPVLPGVKVQYFQRARIDLYPENEPGERVRLASLGVWLYTGSNRGELADLPFTSAACRMFTQYDIAVCYDFLKFYDAHDGAVYFGEPISPLEKMSSGRLVQYFERARMEWWPENPPGMRVVLTSVGSLYTGGTLDYGPGSGPAPNRDGYQLKVHAFMERSLVSPNSTQTVYVVAADQTGQPVAGALVTLVVHLPGGQNVNHRLPETQANGLTQADLPVGDLKPNQIVQIDVTVMIPNGVTTTAHTYFRVWW